MRLHVLVQGMDKSRHLLNSCDNIDFGFLRLEEVVDLIRSIPPPPPGYEGWDCGVTVTVESKDGKAYVMVTMNGLDDYTVLKYDEGSGEEVLVGSSVPFSDVVEALKAFYAAPSGKGLAPGRVRVEEYGINYPAECEDVVGYDSEGAPIVGWRDCNLSITSKAVSGIPISELREVRLLDPSAGRPNPELTLVYGGLLRRKVLRFRFKDLGTYQRALNDLPKIIPPHLIRRSA